MKVLVVDDDVVSRMVLMHLIDGFGGYEVSEAEDGLDAWEQLCKGLRPEVCFCDMRMPRLSGMDLLQKVKGDPALSGIGFVMVSSANEDDVVDEATTRGAAGYIIKPFHGEQVRSHLARLASTAAGICREYAGECAAEAPAETMARLGINAERLLAYLGGFDQQIAAAATELPALLGQTGDALARRLERLHTGCQTLGLHGAASAFAALGAAPEAPALQRALGLTAAAVAAQRASLRHPPHRPLPPSNPAP